MGEQQPVAWRYRYPNDPTWQLTLDEKQARDKTGEVQPLYASPAPTLGVERVDALAQEIRRVDGSNSLGAGALAEALMPFVTRGATLGVEGVAQIIRQHLNAPVASCALLDIDEAARAIVAAMGKNDGATLGVAQIKATIWKHWRNQNGQTLEDRFTSAAEEIAAMEKNDG
jgi:hypothetical protein